MLTLVQGERERRLLAEFEGILGRRMTEIEGDCGSDEIREVFSKAGY